VSTPVWNPGLVYRKKARFIEAYRPCETRGSRAHFVEFVKNQTRRARSRTTHFSLTFGVPSGAPGREARRSDTRRGLSRMGFAPAPGYHVPDHLTTGCAPPNGFAPSVHATGSDPWSRWNPHLGRVDMGTVGGHRVRGPSGDRRGSGGHGGHGDRRTSVPGVSIGTGPSGSAGSRAVTRSSTPSGGPGSGCTLGLRRVAAPTPSEGGGPSLGFLVHVCRCPQGSWFWG
jgi:hypothetical protein